MNYLKIIQMEKTYLSYLMELWFAVHQRETDKYNSISKNLDKYGVPFSIQNKVSYSASESRNKKYIDTLEVKGRIEKIVDNFRIINNQ